MMSNDFGAVLNVEDYKQVVIGGERNRAMFD